MQPINIVPYDPRWPELFEQEKRLLLAAVGPWTASVEHVGSTAVPGLGAKPCIDILVGVRALAEADAHCISRIAALGYIYVPKYEADMPYRRYFFRPADNPELHLYDHSHHIHLVEIGHPFWTRHLEFRDYLRAHPTAAQAYEALKRDLAPRFSSGSAYAEAKTDFITHIEAKARAWRQSR